MTEGPTPTDPREEPPRAPAGGPDAPVEQPPPAYPPADNPPGSDAPRWESPGTPPPPPPAGDQGWGYQQPGGYQQQPGGYQQPGYPQQPGGQYPGQYPGQPASGMGENVASGLSYVLTWLTGLIFYLVDKRPEVRFHAMQSIAYGVIWTLVGVIGPRLPGPLALLFSLLWVAFLIGWVVLLIQGFQGRHFKLPVIGDFAEQQAGRPGL